MINREDMMELTRRMTASRTNLVRLAGAYMDEEGYIDGNFNTNFLTLSAPEKRHTIEIARTILFSATNRSLREYHLPKSAGRRDSIWQLLLALRDCQLKNDALLLTYYELLGEKLNLGHPYAIYVYAGAYDVPLKASDKEELGESEEVYQYLITAICPVGKDLEAGSPEYGFLWPAFKHRSTEMSRVNVYTEEGRRENKQLLDLLNVESAE